MASVISLAGILIVLAIIGLVVGFITRKWVKVGHAFSAICFLTAIVVALSINDFELGLLWILSLFAVGFLINSVIALLSKKK